MLRKFVYFTEDGKCCREITRYKWFSDFANEVQQQQARIQSLHDNFKISRPDFKLLEISSLSNNPVGVDVSIMHLVDPVGNFVEGVYQGSKVYEEGQLEDLYKVTSPLDAILDKRKDQMGMIIGFNVYGKALPVNPWTLTLNWLWCEAVYTHRPYLEEILKYDGFTDYFNQTPKVEWGCYAESASVLVTLDRLGIMDKAMIDIDSFALNVYGIKL